MSTPNYNASQVGVPYVRAHRITINYPEPGRGIPWAVIDQSEAVKLADGSARRIGELPSLQRAFDLQTEGNTPIPLVSPDTGEPLVGPGGPMYTTLTQVMLGILAVVRREQIAVAGAPGV